MIRQYYRPLLALSLVLLAPFSQAAIKVNVTGSVVEGGCKINNGEPIRVEFGNNLQARQLDGVYLLKTIDYTLNCDLESAYNLEIQFNGTASDFNDSYLATDRQGLGIKLYIDGKPMPLNQWMPFTLPHIPVIQAAPVKSNNRDVETGIFNASATLKVQYQ